MPNIVATKFFRFASLLLAILLQSQISFAQSFSEFLREKAVKIAAFDSLGQAVYEQLIGYQVIMLGEQHGTSEPAQFLTGLADLFTAHGDTVLVGYEIPADQLENYWVQPNDSSLLQSEFFTNDVKDGRASKAWASSILQVGKNPLAHIFLFDIDKTEVGANRDSLMYIKIKRQLMAHPTWRVLTLSGNIHNIRQPYKDKLRAAGFLANDLELKLSDKLCSLNLYFLSGTVMNNIGNGLELRQVNQAPSVYSNAVDYSKYLFLYPDSMRDKYDGMFFTRTVTASELAKSK